MPTFNQLLKTPRKPKRKSKQSALKGSPQRKAICLKLYTRSPKKPNSAVRKVAKVRLSSGQQLIVYIPGEAHTIPEHATLLLQGGRTQDLPGVKYKVIRGAYDAKSVTGRRQGRSRYGEKKPS